MFGVDLDAVKLLLKTRSTLSAADKEVLAGWDWKTSAKKAVLKLAAEGGQVLIAAFVLLPNNSIHDFFVACDVPPDLVPVATLLVSSGIKYFMNKYKTVKTIKNGEASS